MSKFIVFEHGSGEVVFVKRDEVSSFLPRYIQKNLYRVFVTIGKDSYVVYETDTLESCKKWIVEQIGIIDGRKESSVK